MEPTPDEPFPQNHPRSVFSDDFEDVGRIGREDGLRRESTFQISAHVPGGISLSLGRVYRAGLTAAGDADVSLLSMSRSRFLGGTVALQATRIDTGAGDWSWSLIYSRQDAAARSLSTLVSRDRTGTSLSAQLAREGGIGPGRLGPRGACGRTFLAERTNHPTHA